MLQFLSVLTLVLIALAQPAAGQSKQFLELRTYTLVDEAAEQKLDQYLQKALIPALNRQGLGPIGAFAQADPSAENGNQVLLLIPADNAEQLTSVGTKLTEDQDYQEAAADYLNTPHDKPLLERIRSELLLSFDSWPQVAVPDQKKNQSDRLFELRIYESATEHLGNLKVEMFNSGEVPIFLDCGIQPVFMGQALIGERLPNLTYMTVYDDSAARDAAWQCFRDHPDWKKLSSVEKYQGTVSNIHKSDWKPKAYSGL